MSHASHIAGGQAHTQVGSNATAYHENGGSDEMDDEASVVVHQVSAKEFVPEEERKERTLKRELNSYQVSSLGPSQTDADDVPGGIPEH